MEVITNKLWLGLPWELLYADDLILLAEIEVELCEKIVNWKVGMEVEGWKMNTGKTRVMFGHYITNKVEEQSVLFNLLIISQL